MKNKLLWIFIGIIVLLLIVGFLYSQGLINVKWQWLTVILAALAAPFQLIASLFSSPNKKIIELQNRQQQRIAEEQQHRLQYDNILREKDQKIKELEITINKMKDRISELELQKQEKEKEIQNINDPQKLQELFIQAYEDESQT